MGEKHKSPAPEKRQHLAKSTLALVFEPLILGGRRISSCSQSCLDPTSIQGKAVEVWFECASIWGKAFWQCPGGVVQVFWFSLTGPGGLLALLGRPGRWSSFVGGNMP